MLHSLSFNACWISASLLESMSPNLPIEGWLRLPNPLQTKWLTRVLRLGAFRCATWKVLPVRSKYCRELESSPSTSWKHCVSLLSQISRHSSEDWVKPSPSPDSALSSRNPSAMIWGDRLLNKFTCKAKPSERLDIAWVTYISNDLGTQSLA